MNFYFSILEKSKAEKKEKVRISKIKNKNNRKKINKTRNLLIEDNEIDNPLVILKKKKKKSEVTKSLFQE